MTPGRIMMWVANIFAGTLLAAALLLVVLEHTWPTPQAYDPKNAFERGSIGTEFIPLPAFLALPKVFPELFPADWMAHYGFLPGGPSGLPFGFTVEYARPINGSPSPVPFVGLTCAVCHTNLMRWPDGKEQVVAGLGNTALDVAPFFEAFRIAMLARDKQGNPVLTIGRIAGGTARNIIASSVELNGSVRTLEPGMSATIEAAVHRILEGLKAGLRVDYALEWTRLTPVLRNDDATLSRVLDAARRVLGTDRVMEITQPNMASEDYAWFAERVPSAHLMIGSGIAGQETSVHRSDYQLNEDVIPIGVRTIAAAVIELMR